jgi:hypothetical protein
MYINLTYVYMEESNFQINFIFSFGINFLQYYIYNV